MISGGNNFNDFLRINLPDFDILISFGGTFPLDYTTVYTPSKDAYSRVHGVSLLKETFTDSLMRV